MIAYDLDGVLVADVIRPAITYEIRILMRSLFIPKGRWCLVTGRPGFERPYTEAWAGRELKENPPERLFHNAGDWEAGLAFKIDVLRTYRDIHMFVESDLEIAKELRLAVPRVFTVTMADLVNGALVAHGG